MSTPESEPNVTPAPTEAIPTPTATPQPARESGTTPPESSTAAVTTKPPDSRLMTYVIILGLLAGGLAWTLGEAVHGTFNAELDLMASLANTQIGNENEAMRRNAALAYGILGGVVGLVLGLGGGLARASTRAGLLAGVVGLITGAAAGAGMSLILIPLHDQHYNPDTQDLLLPMAIHAGIWGLIGLAGGLALTLGAGLKARAPMILIGGLVGALVGTALYEVIGALAFPLSNTVEPLAASNGARLLACLFVALGTALGAAMGMQPAPPRTRKRPTTA